MKISTTVAYAIPVRSLQSHALLDLGCAMEYAAAVCISFSLSSGYSTSALLQKHRTAAFFLCKVLVK